MCGVRLHKRTSNFSKLFKGEGNTPPLNPLPQADGRTISAVVPIFAKCYKKLGPRENFEMDDS